MQLLEDFNLKEILYYKIGPKARYVLKIQKKEDVFEALAFIKEKNIKKILPIGMGANLLMKEAYFDGAILWFTKPEKPVIEDKSNGILEVFAANTLDDLIQYGFSHNLIGLSWAGGLPSSIGGAIRGNAGAFGVSVKTSVQSIEIIDLSDTAFVVKTFNNDAMGFGYRTSIAKQNPNLLIISGTFQLESANEEEIEEDKKIYQSKIDHRNLKNPMEYPSCGSTFKNIREKEDVEKILGVWPDIADMVKEKWYGKVAMGYIVKRLGLSGFTVGGAQVSEKHGNYIINKDNASFDDVYSIIKEIQKRFAETFGFTPEPEVHIVQ